MRILPFVLIAAAGSAVAAQEVRVVRVPGGGIQPQALRDARGDLHLVYFAGDPAAGDLYYVRQNSSGNGFTVPIRVNSAPASAVAIGSIRGAQIALGKNGRLHVAWNGSDRATPKGPAGEAPMLYTRLNDAGSAFEPQRNVIGSAYGLDGGGSVAADDKGNVFVFWHAMAGANNEAGRRVFFVDSHDEGKTFNPETPANREPTGACGCCGMKAWADAAGKVYVLYRQARNSVERGMVFLALDHFETSPRGLSVAPWPTAQCPMSSASFAAKGDAVYAGWEQQGQVFFAKAAAKGPKLGKASFPKDAEGVGQRKHPALAFDSQGGMIFAWTEGTGWNKGGRAAFQLYDHAGKPLGKVRRLEGLPVWGLVAVVGDQNGGFTLIY